MTIDSIMMAFSFLGVIVGMFAIAFTLMSVGIQYAFLKLRDAFWRFRQICQKFMETKILKFVVKILKILVFLVATVISIIIGGTALVLGMGFGTFSIMNILLSLVFSSPDIALGLAQALGVLAGFAGLIITVIIGYTIFTMIDDKYNIRDYLELY